MGGNQDPPGYFDHVIWPGYLKAHEKLFENGDVEKGKLLQPTEEIHGDGEQVKGMVMFEAQSLSLEDIINIAGKEIERGIRAQV
jgi:nicotinamide/nicotinate riboside kinase